jgi:hypothetical protein
MASGSSNSFDIRALLNKLKDKDFIRSILSHLNNALREMTKLGQEKFQEYDEFVTKVDQFKTGLLDYVLDSLVHLRVLQDNFSKRKYQEEKDSAKITFIKRTLDKIDRKVLKAFLIQCIELIALTEKLRDKYGGKMFILEHITFGLVGFVAVGAGLGLLAGIAFTAAAVIPSAVAVGGILGFLFGSVSTVYTLVKNWGAFKDDIQIVRENLSKIKDSLEKVRDQLERTEEQLAKAKMESDNQYEQLNLSPDQAKLTYQEIADLEEYVKATYEAFLELKEIVLHPITKTIS